MLTVAASGIVGRYLYSKIHLGLYGHKAAVQEILADADALKHLLGDGVPASQRIAGELDAFAKLAMAPRPEPSPVFGGCRAQLTGPRATPPVIGRGALAHQTRGKATRLAAAVAARSAGRRPSNS